MTADNFIVSKQIKGSYDDDNLPTRDFAQRIARFVRGFVTKDVNAIVNAKLTI